MSSVLEMQSDSQDASGSSRLKEDLRELERDLEAAALSEMKLLQSLLGTSIDALNFRTRIQGSWSMLGMVAALFLTMDQYNRVVLCPEEISSTLPFCDYVHPFCSGIATIFSATSVLLSVLLYVQMGFVPDEYLGVWMKIVGWAVDIPLLSFIVSVIAWSVSLLWQGAMNYGMLGCSVAALALVMTILILAFYFKLRALTNKYLLQSGDSTKASKGS